MACYMLAFYLRNQAEMVRRIHENSARLDNSVPERFKAATERFVKRTDPETLEKECEALLERVVAEFADIEDLFAKRTLGATAEGELFAMRNLSIGKVAPEITGKDHEGRPFALSNYRGKVVVLTFSAQLVRSLHRNVSAGTPTGRQAEGQAIRAGEREHGRDRGGAQEVDRLGRDHLAVLVRWPVGGTDHDTVGCLGAPDDLRPRQGRGHPLQGRPGADLDRAVANLLDEAHVEKSAPR